MKPCKDWEEPPENNEEFESAVLRAIKTIKNDGSNSFSHKDICNYNKWNFTWRTSRRIGILLNSKFSLIRVNSRSTYSIPEVA